MDKYGSGAPQFGQIIFSVKSKKNDEFWDDQELIDHWEATKELYKKHHSKFKKEDSPPPFGSDKRFQKKRKISSNQKPIPKKKKIKQASNDFIHNHIPPQSPIPSSSIPPSSVPPSLIPSYFNQQHTDASIAQLIHAWYLYGYSIGYQKGCAEKHPS